jgi:hypothetical protein
MKKVATSDAATLQLLRFRRMDEPESREKERVYSYTHRKPLIYLVPEVGIEPT